ncbi:Argininosuccinate synthase [bioreactor metagenome]|uniref:Argininosuccinate synthase n=2 Tax=root TaxID=1 RepID=A0A652ZZ38_9SPIR|nr:Argininosuccinate synthase [uncultured Spirochaetota bacterium]
MHKTAANPLNYSYYMHKIPVMKKKIVLAYSGGLDTTVIVPWLKESYDCEVVAVCGDVGQEADWAAMEKRALSSGAQKFIRLDQKEEFVSEHLWALVKAGSPYEKKYLLGTSAARPLLAKGLAQVALAEGAHAVAHGCTGKGNDQVRFELGIKAFAPEMEVIAPWRIWDIQSREEEIEYLEKRGIPVPMKKSDSYSRDDNLWHISHEGLDLEDPANEPRLEGMLKMSVPPEKAPDKAEYITLGFEKGIPVSVNGKRLNPVSLVKTLNKIGGAHGVGIVDMVENRVIGMKSRGVYETPGGTIIMEAHDKLEQLCLDKKTLSFKLTVAQRFAEILYEGEWFSPLCKALCAFVDSTQNVVTGTVTLKLFKGSIIHAGASSPYSLYDASLASFTTGPLFSHRDSTGFINLFGLPTKVRARLEARIAKDGSASGPDVVKPGSSGYTAPAGD